MSEGVILIDREAGGTAAVKAIPGRVRGERIEIPAAALNDHLGWRFEAEGLCRGDVCVPVRDRAALEREGFVDVEALASALGRAYAAEPALATAALGGNAGARGRQLASLEAPDFTLPDLAGKLHSLSDHRGKKVLLIAYGSW